MTKRIVTNSLSNYHQDCVVDAMEKLQENGFEVLGIKPISKPNIFNLWMGEWITDIIYQPTK